MPNEKYSFDLKKYQINNGNGPSIVITGGIHGVEQTGSYTAELVWQKLAKENVLGEITIYPICNLEAAKVHKRGAPQDDMDLNRIFPGKEDGSYSEQLARHIWNLTEGYDYILDLHCCGQYGSTYTMCWYSRYEFCQELCKALGVDIVIHTMGTRGQLYIEGCEVRGQKGLLIELPGGQPSGFIDVPAAEKLSEQIINYLKHINIVEGPSTLHDVHFCSTLFKQFPTETDGIYKPAVTPGSFVKEGEPMAYLNGEALNAPCDVVVTSTPPMRYVYKGDNLLRYASASELPFGAIVCKERDL